MKERYFINNFVNMKKRACLPHAVLLESTDDFNRINAARFLAQLILCEKDAEGDLIPCGTCRSCVKFSLNSHPDFKIITNDGGSKFIQVDKIRQMRIDSFIVPNEAGKKVYLVENAQNMTKQAQNAVLKTLEEPSDSAVFILSCKSSKELLDTVVSRTQTFKLDFDNFAKSDDKKELQIIELAEEIISNIIDKADSNLFLMSSKFIKDKALFESVLLKMDDIISDIIREKFVKQKGKSYINDEVTQRFIGIKEIIRQSYKKISGNINQNLLVTWFFMNLTEYL